jgi:hypothetical protein
MAQTGLGPRPETDDWLVSAPPEKFISSGNLRVAPVVQAMNPCHSEQVNGALHR